MIRKIALVAAFALSGTAAQADSQNFTVSIDGYCTVLQLHIQGELVAGTRSGSTCATNGLPPVTVGGVVATVDGDTGVVVSETDSGKVYTWLFEQPTDGTGTVYVVSSNGKGSRRTATGTYHILRGPHADVARRNGPDFMDQLRAVGQVRK